MFVEIIIQCLNIGLLCSCTVHSKYLEGKVEKKQSHPMMRLKQLWWSLNYYVDCISLASFDGSQVVMATMTWPDPVLSPTDCSLPLCPLSLTWGMGNKLHLPYMLNVPLPTHQLPPQQENVDNKVYFMFHCSILQ